LLDDSTGKPVDVVSMTNGIVISTVENWKPGSKLRGGNYVKIYDINESLIFYYSHLSRVDVLPGKLINAGDKIGEVGRTGRKANLIQGKTHLHIAMLKFKNGYPKPAEFINELKSKELTKNTEQRN
jgi:murein DD-endopeptidase MepM/ murein hydrolase activator NlpD